MRPFRGTLIALVVLVLVGLVVALVRPDLFRAQTQEEDDRRLFAFEKHELVRVDVVRPDGAQVSLVEGDGDWTIDGTGFVAGRSMVNRIKHQIHDLTARATVVEDPESPELYGLGKNAVQVKLTLRDGRIIEFLAGDPNPSSVSYYLQRKDDPVVYTVKKAAVDYYSLTLEEFRERRFASFDSKDATRIRADVDGQRLELERVGDDDWQMHAPEEMVANAERVRRLLGRVSALKAQDFVEKADLAQYGLDSPRAVITIELASGDPIELKVGGDAPSESKYDELAYMTLGGEGTVYVAKKGLLEEFAADPSELRNRRLVRMKVADVVAVDVWLKSAPDDDLAGEAGVRYAAEQWLWKDGVPVPGSTPKRVAERVAELEAAEFVEDDAKDLSPYGLVEWRAKVVLQDREGAEKTVLFGSQGPPVVDPEGREHPRYYATIDETTVFLIEEGVLSVLQDMIREYNRKASKDAEKASRRERIESVGDPTAEEDAP